MSQPPLLDEAFIEAHTEGFHALRTHVDEVARLNRSMEVGFGRGLK